MMRPALTRSGRKIERETRRVVDGLRRARARRTLRTLPCEVRLHLGCGHNRLAGWVNVDIERSLEPDVRHDLRLGLPVRSGSVTAIYSEHVVEHLSLNAAERLFSDCRRSLVPSGVLRVAMPDLEALVSKYLGEWWDQEWIANGPYPLETSAQMLNLAMREWGHQYLYDFADLSMRLERAGFRAISRVQWGLSEHAFLRGLESRPDSLLIAEAVAP